MFSSKETITTDRYKMNQFQKRFIAQNRPDTKEHFLCDSNDMIPEQATLTYGENNETSGEARTDGKEEQGSFQNILAVVVTQVKHLSKPIKLHT